MTIGDDNHELFHSEQVSLLRCPVKYGFVLMAQEPLEGGGAVCGDSFHHVDSADTISGRLPQPVSFMSISQVRWARSEVITLVRFFGVRESLFSSVNWWSTRCLLTPRRKQQPSKRQFFGTYTSTNSRQDLAWLLVLEYGTGQRTSVIGTVAVS